MKLRIAYLINQYPKISHSFIRREILALERQGVKIQRIALRGWNAELVDAEDHAEQERTQYVLRRGLLALIPATLHTFLFSPIRFFAALGLALRIGWHATRPLPYHLAYFVESCQVLRYVRAFGAQHLHAHFGTNSAEIAMLVRALGGPSYSFTAHGPEEFDNAPFLGIDEKVRRAAFVVAISSYGRSQLYRWVDHMHWDKVRIVHCGLDSTFHLGKPDPPGSTSRLVCVGRLCEQKGQLLLVEAAHRLAAKGIEFDLVLAGDGEMREQLEKLIRRRRLEKRVRISGWINSKQVREEVLAARALVQPSFAEGLPVVIMEAMVLCRPVLATYVAGIPELILPGETGWLFPPGSVDDLVTAMEDCLSKSPDELQRMGEAGYRRVLERHSIDVEAAKLLALFQEVDLRGMPVD